MEQWIKNTCKYGDFYTNSDRVNIQAYGNDYRWPDLWTKILNNEVEVINAEDTQELQDAAEKASRLAVIREIEVIESGLMRSTIGLMKAENSEDRAIFDAGVAKIEALREKL